MKNCDRINAYLIEYIENRIKTDDIFRLIHNKRRRIHRAIKGETKPFSTIDILGIVIETYENWIIFQLTREMIQSNIEIDHVRHISSFHVSKDGESKEAFNWKNTRPVIE